MKKIFFIAAIAALALSSCSSDEIVTPQPVEDGAVVFSANTLRDTRDVAVKTPIAKAVNLANAGGFGVFGYEHGDKDYATFSASSSAPNFFYNQQVWAAQTSNATEAKIDFADDYDSDIYWLYSPIKYYSNNKGAKHSFFAYAPFQEDVNNVFALGSAPAIKYSSKENYDLMWAAPYKNLEKPGVNYKLLFNFQHALSKVDIKVAPFVDEVHSGTDAAGHPLKQALDDNTTIVVRSVKFVGVLASEGLLSLEDGSWKYIATEESAYEINTPVILKKEDQTSGDPLVHEYQDVTTNMMVIPTSVGEGVKIQVVYDVITKDNANSVNNSTVTNTITSKDPYKLEAGKAYTFNLDLGMTTVKFNATVTNWDAENNTHNVDLPNNTYAEPVALTAKLAYVSSVSKLTDFDEQATDGHYRYANAKLEKYSSDTWAKADAGTYNDKNTVYVVTDDGTTTVYSNVTAFGTGTTFQVYNGSDAYASQTATEVKSVVPDSKGKLYNTSGTAVVVAENAYIVCDGKLYQWKGTATTASNRR